MGKGADRSCRGSMNLLGDPAVDPWQHGYCAEYALALVARFPQLQLGVAGAADPHADWDPYADAPEPLEAISHVFAHDEHYAYDSRGRHPLPYHPAWDAGFEPPLPAQRLGLDRDQLLALLAAHWTAARGSGSWTPDPQRLAQAADEQVPVALSDARWEELLSPWAARWDRLSDRARERLLHHAPRIHYQLYGPGPARPSGKCNRACQLWAQTLRQDGLPVRVLGGHYDPALADEVPRARWQRERWEYHDHHPESSSHTWLELEGQLVDPTAGQFAGPAVDDFLAHYYPYNAWDGPFDEAMWSADWPALD